MQILAHRGFWKKINQKNSPKSFKNALKNGFGIETDLRDLGGGGICVSHDIPTKNALKIDEFFKIYTKFSQNTTLKFSHNFAQNFPTNSSKFSPKNFAPLALNIKADGLNSLLKKALKKHKITNYFCFDMSIPQMISYLDDDFLVFGRQSEFEKSPLFYDQICGVWLDEFSSHWINESVILSHLANGKKVCVVSPELHGREFLKEWGEYKKIIKNNNLGDEMILCTDFPLRAREFFA